LRQLFADPDFAALLEAAPQMRRLLRPLGHMLGVRLPPPPASVRPDPPPAASLRVASMQPPGPTRRLPASPVTPPAFAAIAPTPPQNA
jgi:hypothetical protein